MRNSGLYLLFVLFIVCSCNDRQQDTGFNPHELTKTVMWIDSLNNEIISQLSGETPEIIKQETGIPYSDKEIKESRLKVAKDWSRFVKYIRRQQFDRAAVYILDNDVRGSILGHLRGSILRSIFILDVLHYLILEYHEDVYYSTCAAWMYDEVLIEITINGISNGEPHDVAETFPRLVEFYGNILASAGCLNNALELVPIYDLANQYFNPEDDLYVQFQKACYENTIYHLAGDAATGDSILLDFRDNVTPEYGARGKDAAKDVDEIIAYWIERKLE